MTPEEAKALLENPESVAPSVKSALCFEAVEQVANMRAEYAVRIIVGGERLYLDEYDGWIRCPERADWGTLELAEDAAEMYKDINLTIVARYVTEPVEVVEP